MLMLQKYAASAAAICADLPLPLELDANLPSSEAGLPRRAGCCVTDSPTRLTRTPRGNEHTGTLDWCGRTNGRTKTGTDARETTITQRARGW